MMKRMISVLCAIAVMLGMGLGASEPAQAAPGHVTLNCNTYNSSGWHLMVANGVERARVCLTIHSHGDHEDVTYWIYDSNCDGADAWGYRNLSWVDDGWVEVVSPSGCGTYDHSNKQYDIGTDLRGAQLKGWSEDAYANIVYTDELTW
jgi:hypothetical protein